eukprot:SM000172S03090  [mRNA]  locus=s172:286416:292351:- [translate_table: standard]
MLAPLQPQASPRFAMAGLVRPLVLGESLASLTVGQTSCSDGHARCRATASTAGVVEALRPSSRLPKSWALGCCAASGNGAAFTAAGHGHAAAGAVRDGLPLDMHEWPATWAPECGSPLSAGSAEARDGQAGALADHIVLPVVERSARLGGPDNSTPVEGTNMLAAVDLGTNSFHMVIVQADSSGRFQIVDVEKEDVRLGSGSSGLSLITPEAEERSLAAIKRLQRIAATWKASMRVVATSAVREARNRRTFLRRIESSTGIDVEVLSGREEACLIYNGILQALPVYSKTVLTVDIGGGSTEFVLGREGKPLFATSLKLGHIRLTERCLAGDPVLQRTQVEDLRRYIRVMLADSGVLENVRAGKFEVAIGSSGTIETIEQMINMNIAANLALLGPEHNGTQRAHGFKERVFTREELTALVKKLCKAKTAEARAKLPGLPEKRADLIVGGSILLEEIFYAMGIEKMSVSPYALREGVIVDTLTKTYDNYSPAPDIRRSSVINLAKRFNTDRRLDSALHSARLAKQMLQGLQTCKAGGQACMAEIIAELNENDAELMEAATILHYVGMFISHKCYHKHSQYLIKNNEHLLGYSPMEIEIIALLARYHRKKVPSSKDEDLAKLPQETQNKLRTMCSVMRIAVALDRCASGAVQTVHVLQDKKSCVLAVTPSLDPATQLPRDLSLEVWAAKGEQDYFEKLFKKTVSFIVADQHDVEDGLEGQASRSLSS